MLLILRSSAPLRVVLGKFLSSSRSRPSALPLTPTSPPPSPLYIMLSASRATSLRAIRPRLVVSVSYTPSTALHLSSNETHFPPPRLARPRHLLHHPRYTPRCIPYHSKQLFSRSCTDPPTFVPGSTDPCPCPVQLEQGVWPRHRSRLGNHQLMCKSIEHSLQLFRPAV